MIWDEFLRHFRFCDEEDSGLSDVLEKFKTASKRQFLNLAQVYFVNCFRGCSAFPYCYTIIVGIIMGRRQRTLLVLFRDKIVPAKTVNCVASPNTNRTAVLLVLGLGKDCNTSYHAVDICWNNDWSDADILISGHPYTFLHPTSHTSIHIPIASNYTVQPCTCPDQQELTTDCLHTSKPLL